MENKNMVVTLVAQHRQLQKDLNDAAQALEKSLPDIQSINMLLKKFSHDLMEHLHLENDVFYVELLRQMKEKGQNTEKTEQFISEMDSIGKTVMTFLSEYSSEENLVKKKDNFARDLPIIIRKLTLRIESEEAGVYTYWV